MQLKFQTFINKMNRTNIIVVTFVILLAAVQESQSCRSLSQSISRVWSSLIPVRGSTDVATDKFGFDVSRINSPGQRFTATHGISANKGERKVFVFDVDRPDVNYIAVSSNIALEGSNGGPEKYELYMKYGSIPTPNDYDLKSSLTASDSYVGTVLYSRDITVQTPAVGQYYLTLVVQEDIHELLMTAIMDTPPDERQAAFTIRRMGQLAH